MLFFKAQWTGFCRWKFRAFFLSIVQTQIVVLFTGFDVTVFDHPPPLSSYAIYNPAILIYCLGDKCEC